MRAVTAEQMRRIDRLAQRRFGIPELILMEQAGTAVARAALRLRRGNRPVLVLAGAGANGGDGLVAARHLHNAAIPVRVLLLADPARVRGSTATNLRIVRKLGIPVAVIRSVRRWNPWERKKPSAGLIIDALLGTGLRDDVREPIRSAIEWINRQRSPVIAVDLPSGLCSDTGRPCGTAVRARHTVTLGLPKTGLTRAAARTWSGSVEVVDISLPRVLVKGKKS